MDLQGGRSRPRCRSASSPPGWSARTGPGKPDLRAGVGSRGSWSGRSRFHPSRKAVGAKFAGRTFPAAETPDVARGALAEITAVGLLDQQIDQRIPTEFLGEREGSRLVDPHQRRAPDEPALPAELERELHGPAGSGRPLALA